jgi:anti-anti-sigma factor
LELREERERLVMASDFAHPAERALAQVFDRHGIAWRYEPHTFVLERDGDGNVREAFTPDFFLPDLGLYVECTVMRQAHTGRKRRKARLAKERAGAIVEIMFRRDFERLGRTWGLEGLAEAGRVGGDVSFAPAAGTTRTGVTEPARMVETREIFDLGVEERPGTAVVTVVGDVDLHSAPFLRDELASLADGDVRTVVLDLAGATFLDSMALGVILAAKKRLASDHGRLEVVVSTPDIRRIFEITMLDRILDLHDTREDALRGGGPATV